MRISARGAAAAVMGSVILAGPLVLAPSSFAAAATPATVTAAVDQQPMSTQMIQTAQQYAAGLHHLHGAAFEQAFMGAMIPHHAAAVAMARLELTRGSNPQLKALARQIIASQSREITQMTSWLHTRYHMPARPTSVQP